MIDIKEFVKRYTEFEKIDFRNKPHTFAGFWSYKLKLEKQGTHLLDRDNQTRTLLKLGPILKIWQWHRPYEFEYCFRKFKTAIKKVSGSYDRIRDFSLTNLEQVPTKELKSIWIELGSIKPQRGQDQGKLVMTITKPLMFLWGKTPAFDSVLRERMPLSGVDGFRNVRWEFNTWITAMRRLQKYLAGHQEVLECFKKISLEKYGTDKKVPYGQFFDLYYWTKSKEQPCAKEAVPSNGEKESTIYEENHQEEEFRNFILLLNKIKTMGKISAEEWREYRKQWQNDPKSRSILVEKLKHI